MPRRVPAEAALLAELTRGGIVEGLVRGHVVLVDGQGHLVNWTGDPNAVSTLRSAAKPFQAASFVDLGAQADLGLGEESLAIACASHHGEPGHLLQVRRILDAVGLDERALRCGAHLPVDPAATAELLRAGASPTPVHNNCSGKHAAMVATCIHQGWPVDSYLDREHPLQRRIAIGLAEHAQLLEAEMPFGIDGCGLPTFGLPLHSFARALVHAAASDAPFQSCQTAMARHPWLIGGTTSFDTALVRAAGDRLTAKGGAAAIFGAAARDGSWALAIKLESGSSPGLPQVAVEALRQLGLIGADEQRSLEDLAPGEVSNWAGTVVGEIRPQFRL